MTVGAGEALSCVVVRMTEGVTIRAGVGGGGPIGFLIVADAA